MTTSDDLMPFSGEWIYDTHSYTPIGFYNPKAYYKPFLQLANNKLKCLGEK